VSVHSLIIVCDGFNDRLETSDIALVLGNKVNEDGTLSKRLKSRLDKCTDLYKEGYFDKIIVSGGVGKEGQDEAFAMKKYLLLNYIPEDCIIADSTGYDTFLSAKATKKILEDENLNSVMIITNYYHISRTRMTLKKFDIQKIYSAHADCFELRDPLSTFREFAAYYYYLFRKA